MRPIARIRLACLAMAAIAVSAVAPAPAQAESASAYTRWDLKSCRILEKDEAVQIYRCPGRAGVPVIVNNGADATAVYPGAKELAADWPVTGFFFAKNNVVEWRYDRNGSPRPYAAIVRYDVGRTVGGPFRQKLVVFRVTDAGQACVAGAIDAQQANANTRARTFADTYARSFRCGIDKAAQ